MVSTQVCQRKELSPAALEFLSSLVGFAQFAQRATSEKFEVSSGEVTHGLDASLVLAVWLHLMDWGRNAMVKNSNLALIEASTDWRGKTVVAPGKTYKIYPLYIDFVVDWTDEMASHQVKRYGPIFRCQTLKEQIKKFCQLNSLPQARIESLIERYGLTEFSVANDC